MAVPLNTHASIVQMQLDLLKLLFYKEILTIFLLYIYFFFLRKGETERISPSQANNNYLQEVATKHLACRKKASGMQQKGSLFL